MAAIFKEISIGWQGEEYTVTPSMRLINRIEQEVSIAHLAMRLTAGEAPMAHLATVFSHVLRAGGADVEPEDVLMSMMGNGDDDATEVIKAAALILEGLFPANAPKKKKAKPTS